MKIGIVLGGGGAKGSFQAGVLKYISELPDVEIVAITGTSVGALNGALASIGEFSKIINLWKGVDEDNSFYPNYKLGKTYGILSEGSIYSNGWLKNQILSNIPLSRLLETETYFGCVSTDLKSGNPIFANNNDSFFFKNLLNYILASASLPPVFPSISLDGYSLVDGGISSPIPVKEILYFNTPIDKIIIIPAGTNKMDYDISTGFINENVRVLDVLYSQLFNTSLEKGLEKYWSLNKKFVVVDSIINICSTLTLKNRSILDFIDHGYSRAHDILKNSLI